MLDTLMLLSETLTYCYFVYGDRDFQSDDGSGAALLATTGLQDA